MDKKQLVIYVDGASRGNPGNAGIGIIIYDSKGKVLWEEAQYLGKATNNVAEYIAVIYGLQEGIIRKAKNLTIYTDSELLVRQVDGRYQIKNHFLKNLFLLIKHLSTGFEKLTVKYIDRGKNKEADRLANKAIDLSL
ncbi:MAG: 14.7 kDa ribonuclease H-like protein [Firmicutes bacterium]|nr:14.7 kDa ribonuclease H-like protein [Bacillota bacterium]